MANLRIFISSTAYDLSLVRSQIRGLAVDMGYEPVMSDYSDVLFDPRLHTHVSCIREVPGCDMLILIIGSRFGDRAIPEAITQIDFEVLKKDSFEPETLENIEHFSVTQVEVLKAVEAAVPVFAFVDEAVLHDHRVYEKNKAGGVADKITFPSIERAETAKYIFSFIDFLRQRVKGNAVVPFSRVEDIEDHLKRQWAGLFQRLLYEERTSAAEGRRIDWMSEQLEDLKTAILTTIRDDETRQVARGVVRFRFLVDLLRALRVPEGLIFSDTPPEWNEVLEAGQVIAWTTHEGERSSFPQVALLRPDGAYSLRVSPERFANLSSDWEELAQLGPQSRRAIVDALAEASAMRVRSLLRFLPDEIDPFQPSAVPSSTESETAPAD